MLTSRTVRQERQPDGAAAHQRPKKLKSAGSWRLHRFDGRCTPDSCRLAAAPKSAALGHQPTFVAHFPEWKLKLWSGSIRCASLGRPLWSRALRPSADCQARRLAPKDEGPHARERTEVKLLRRELIKAEDDAVQGIAARGFNPGRCPALAAVLMAAL